MIDVEAGPSLDLAVIVPHLDKYGGAERLVVECLARWQDRHRITLYASSINEQLLAEHAIGSRVTRVLLSPEFTGEHAILLNATLLPKVWRREIGHHDVYHTHLWPMHLLDLHPMVWYPHEPLRALHDLRFDLADIESGEASVHFYPKHDYDRLAEGLYEPYLQAISAVDHAAQPELVVANSRYSAGYLRQVYGYQDVPVVYPGAQPSAALTLPRDPNLFVTISQLWSHKRPRILIEALSRTDQTQLLVLGSGPEQPWLQGMVERLGVADRVFFLSGLRNSEMELILARACAFLFSPIQEPFGIAVLEAMAAGLPIVAANEGGYVEVCTPENAFLVAPEPSAFAARMSQLQADPRLRDQMGAASRSIAAQYTWDRTARELEAHLLSLAPARRVSAAAGGQLNRPLVGAQYYLWYGEGYGAPHWNDSAATGYVSDMPAAGYYGSTKGTTIARHLEAFEDLGLDYAVLNLHIDDNGVNQTEWSSILRAYQIAAERRTSVKLAVQIAPYTTDLSAIVELLRDIQQDLASSPSQLRLDDRPVLFWFWTGLLDNQPANPLLMDAAANYCNIASALRLPLGERETSVSGGIFSGFAPYSPLELADRENRATVWSMAYRGAEAAGMRWKATAMSPGYDDTVLSDPRRELNRRRTVDRAEGRTYQECMAFVEGLSPPPDLVTITSFNEFHENTHIEPSTRHGATYFDMTRDFVQRLRQRSAP